MYYDAYNTVIISSVWTVLGGLTKLYQYLINKSNREADYIFPGLGEKILVFIHLLGTHDCVESVIHV